MARETVRIEGLAGVLEQLRALPPEIVSKAGGPVKLALKKAAELLRDEARRNVRAIVLEPNADGLPSDSTGLLEQNIVAGRSRMRGAKGERYAVRVRRKPYDVTAGAKPVSTPQVGRLLEYGTEQRQPMSWLRTAFDAKKNAALALFVSELRTRTNAAIQRAEKLARMKK